VRAATGPGFNPTDGDDFANEEEELLLFGSAFSERSEKTLGTIEVKVFPNPVSDQFSLTADSEIQSWAMYNAVGTVVQREESTSATQTSLIQVADLPAGMYYLMVQTANGSAKKQVEVLR
jgi:hypothetical protein